MTPMPERPPNHRKRRTRQHVIADQCVNYVERFVFDAGHTAQRVGPDYGYDLYVSTFDDEGFTEPGVVYMQLKATDNIEHTATGTDVVFDLAVQDYDLWRHEVMPVMLVLYDARKRRAWWLYLQRYFAEDAGRRPRKDAKSVRVWIPAKQRFSRRTVKLMRTWKHDISLQSYGRIHHA
jgi:hypothetical protein